MSPWSAFVGTGLGIGCVACARGAGVLLSGAGWQDWWVVCGGKYAPSVGAVGIDTCAVGVSGWVVLVVWRCAGGLCGLGLSAAGGMVGGRDLFALLALRARHSACSAS